MEAIFLASGAGGPQLKRNPLGSTAASFRLLYLVAGGHMTGQGSTGNVIAALCSFFIPGLGQLLQARLFIAIIQFVLAALLWFFLLGWLIHLWSILDAALWKPKQPAAP
jgi:TM2 domain-containing membrane protein YozV